MTNKHGIIFILFLLSWNSYGQANLKQIREDYYKYKNEESQHKTFEIRNSYDYVNQEFTFYFNENSSILFYIILKQSSEFHGINKEYFFKNNKLFFIYVKDLEENYFDNHVRKYW